MISMTFTGPLSVKLLQALFCKSCLFYKREHQNRRLDSEQFRTIQIQPKDLIQFAPLRSGVATSIWRQEGYMAPKPKPATVGMVLAMALTILAAMTWAVAQPSLSLIYRPELPLLY